MTIRVSRVAKESPKITVMAKGFLSSEEPPQEIAMGSIPKTVEIVVIRIGRSLLLPASKIASLILFPLLTSLSIKSTLTIASFTTIPISIINPIMDIILIDIPNNARPKTTPNMERGTANMIIKGESRDSN